MAANEEAAIVSGVPVKKVMARSRSWARLWPSPVSCKTLPFQRFHHDHRRFDGADDAACVIGGVSLRGGVGPCCVFRSAL
jgi:ABC-type glucose/galactose transport system permease subunit